MHKITTVQGRTGKMFKSYPYFPRTIQIFRVLLKLLNIGCAAHIGMDGMRIEKEPRQKDEYVYRIS